MQYILTAVIYKLPGPPYLKPLKLKQVLTENNYHHVCKTFALDFLWGCKQ